MYSRGKWELRRNGCSERNTSDPQRLSNYASHKRIPKEGMRVSNLLGQKDNVLKINGVLDSSDFREYGHLKG